jgi:hypothetical protein
MALVLADRVRDTTTTTSTGTVTLSGTAPTGYQTFATAIGNGNTTYYTINAGFQWEVGIGTFTTSGNTLTRTTVLSSSSGGALVDFAAGTKDVFVTYPAEKSVNYDGSNNVGIGTTAPTTKLDIRGAAVGANFSAISVDNSSAGSGSPANTVSVNFSNGGAVKASITGAVYGDGYMAFATNTNTEKMRLDASGNLGIGTNAPVGPLNVVATDTSNTIGSATASINITNYDAGAFGRTANLNFTVADGNLTTRRLATISAVYVGFGGGSTEGALAFATQFNGSLSERMRITSAGLVGIGTSAPAKMLSVYQNQGGLRLTHDFLLTDYSEISVTTGGLTGTSAMIRSYRAATDGYGNEGDLRFYTNVGVTSGATDASERMRIDRSGNVLVGTTTADNKLTVSASSSGAAAGVLSLVNPNDGVGTAADLDFVIHSSATLATGRIRGLAAGADNYPMSFWTYGSGGIAERMRLNANGNFAIGNTGYGNKLDVYLTSTQYALFGGGIGTGNGNYAGIALGYSEPGPIYQKSAIVQAQTGDGSARGTIHILNNNAASTANATLADARLSVTSDGNVGIGDSAPGYRLVVKPAAFAGGTALVPAINIIANGGATGGNTSQGAIAWETPAGTRVAAISPFFDDPSATFRTSMAFFTSTLGGVNTERMRINSDGDVGIGTTTLTSRLNVISAGGTDAAQFSDGGNYTFAMRSGGAIGVGLFTGTVGSAVAFGANNTEKMRLTTGGDLGIGTTAPAYKLDVVGTISANGGMRPVFLVGSAVANSIYWDGVQFYPSIDGTILLGYPSWRWGTVYAATGTINTSDGNEKQDINLLNDAEKNVAVRLKSLVRSFKFNDAVAAKGAAARVHFGLIAQDVASAFEAEGLYPHRYAMFCSDTWYEVDGKPSTDVNDPFTKDTEGAVEKTRLGIRYDELIVFMISVL